MQTSSIISTIIKLLLLALPVIKEMINNPEIEV